VLAAKQDALAQRLEKMEFKLDNYAGNFITHEVFELRMREFDVKIKDIDLKIATAAKQRWVQNTLSAVLGAILTGLIGYILYGIFAK